VSLKITICLCNILPFEVSINSKNIFKYSKHNILFKLAPALNIRIPIFKNFQVVYTTPPDTRTAILVKSRTYPKPEKSYLLQHCWKSLLQMGSAKSRQPVHSWPTQAVNQFKNHLRLHMDLPQVYRSISLFHCMRLTDRM